MNQAPTTQSSNSSAQSLFNGAFKSGFESKEYEQIEPVEPTGDTVPDSDERSKTITNHWAEFYSLKSEDITPQTSESPVRIVEVSERYIESQATESSQSIKNEEVETGFQKPLDIIDKQTGSGSALEEAWAHMEPAKKLKGLAKNLFGGLSVFGELFMDAIKYFSPKDKKAEAIETDPQKAQAAAEKKAEKQKKKNNISIFLQAMQSQIASIISPDAQRMETQEKATINLTAKIGNESYKGIKDTFGRLTVYASSLFERAQMDQEKQAKKQEKEQKMASAGGKGPDLNMDKVAEGGFLSSTGGQGAG